MRRSGAVASDAVAAEVADTLLLDGHSAIAAVVGAFFAAAGSRSGVLLGPVTLVLGGVGTGTRVLDGRARQPGLGAKRPRGYRDEDVIPDAARVAAPAGVAALLVALTYDEHGKLAPVLAPGIQRARTSGSTARAELLSRIGGIGARALADVSVVRPLLARAGPVEGGALTAKDLETVGAVDVEPHLTSAGDLILAAPPWAGDIEETAAARHVVMAMDAHGGAAALCFEDVAEGLQVPELDLVLPLAAVPVRRGVERIAPGAPLTACAPLGLWLRERAPVEVRGDAEPREPERYRYGLVREEPSRRVKLLGPR